jgi:hypothetical protein
MSLIHLVIDMSKVVHGSHHIVSSRFGEYESDRLVGLVGALYVSIKVLVHLECIWC